MKLALRLVPKGPQDRFQAFVKTFEWTWTKAVVISLVLWLIGIGLLGILPSWWLYFASDKLGWRRCPCPTAAKFWLFKARDLVAVIIFSIPFGGMIMIPYHLQKLRRRLRSESETRPTGGYR